MLVKVVRGWKDREESGGKEKVSLKQLDWRNVEVKKERGVA